MATIVKRRLANGGTSYKAIVRRCGKSKKKTFRTRAAAERWATSTEAKILDGVEVPAASDERRTVEEVLAAYLESGALDGLRTAPQRRAQLQWWRERLGGHRLLTIDRQRVRSELMALERGATPSKRPAGPATRRRYLAALRAAFAWAVDVGLARSNPAAGAARKGRDVEPEGRVRYLRDGERAALLAACAQEKDPRVLPLVKLALLTGMRQGELLGLRWRDLDLTRGLASLPRAKAGKRPVALSAPAVEIFRDLHARRVVGWELVFATPPYGRASFPREAWERLVRVAGLEDFHFHDLRHCFATMLLSAGATLPELAAALGHRTLSMVARYAHLEKPHAARLVELVAERIDA